MIATPTMTGDVCHEYVTALVAMVADLNSRGVAVDLRFYPGCCYLELARNELADQFMASDCDKLLFIDADIAGFMMISRDVFECLQIRFPARQMKRRDGTTIWNYFPQGQEGQEWVGEDVRFCRMWAECGGDMWVIPDLNFAHVGRKAFFGNWHEYAQRLPGGHLGPALEDAA